MTQSTEVALPEDFDLGLEDLDSAGMSLPRVRIVHDQGLFVDSQTNEEFPNIFAVPLGMVKQRAMFAREVQDDSKPLCKSNDAENGYPNIGGPSHSLFPWTKAGINPASVPKDEFERPVLRCSECPFSQWSKDSDGKNVPPPCAERYTIPMYYSTEPNTVPDRVGVISFQKSGITPAKKYLSAFKQSKSPLFVAFTRITLETNKRGNVTYSTPKFQRLAATETSEWQTYADEYRTVRESLRRAPFISDEDKPVGAASNNSWNPAGGAAQSQPVEAQVVEEPDPWATTQQVTTQQESWPPASQPMVAGGLVNAAAAPVAASRIDDDDLPF